MVRPQGLNPKKIERKKCDSDVATGVNDGVASFSSWSIPIHNHETHFTRIRGVVATTSTSIWRWIPCTSLPLSHRCILYTWTNCIMVLVFSIWTSKRPTWASRCCIEVFWVTLFLFLGEIIKKTTSPIRVNKFIDQTLYID
jgi:hypothetical protein